MKWLAVLLALSSSVAWAHKPSDSYLRLKANGSTVIGRWDLAVRDVDLSVGLDGNGDGSITFAELEAKRAAVLASALGSLRISQEDHDCGVTPGVLQVVRHSDGAYVVVRFEAVCPNPVDKLEVSYAWLFDLDAQHRGLLRLEGSSSDTWTVFTAQERTRTVSWEYVSAGTQTGLAIREGVHHILVGWDHLCFLFSLLLPSVWRRRDGRWEAVPSLKPAIIDVLKVVTSFTLAHSLTLGLAAFGLVSPEPKWVEVAIAVSVALAAANTLGSFLPEGRWSLAFGLGLLHGFGFVSALADLGGSRIWLSVFGFNLGVELGQGAIVALFVPLAYLVRGTAAYRVGARVAAAAIFVVALHWVWQRIGL